MFYASSHPTFLIEVGPPKQIHQTLGLFGWKVMTVKSWPPRFSTAPRRLFFCASMRLNKVLVAGPGALFWFSPPGAKIADYVVTTISCMNSSTLGWFVTTAAIVRRILGSCNFLISLLMTLWLGTIICIIPFIHGHPFISMICTNNLLTYSLC